MNFRIDASPSVTGATFNSRQTLDIEAFTATYGGVVGSAHKPGAPLYVQGEPADFIYYIHEGQVQLTIVSNHGKEAIIAVLNAGDFFGESCLIGGQVRVSTAICIANSVVSRLERSSVVRAIRCDPLIAEFFIVHILRRAFRLREDLISQLFDSSERRLAHALVLLANTGKECSQMNVIKNIDQEALAQMIGTTRPRVNYFMNKFRKLGYIDYEGGVISVHSSLSGVALREDAFGASDDRMAAAS